jgi:hypothetical protein
MIAPQNRDLWLFISSFFFNNQGDNGASPSQVESGDNSRRQLFFRLAATAATARWRRIGLTI